MATPERKLQFHNVHQEEPISYAFFKRNHTMILLPVLFLIGFFVFWMSGRAHMAIAGYLFIVAEAIFFWLFVRLPNGREVTRLATGSRKAMKAADGALGYNRHVANLADLGKFSNREVVKKLGRVDIDGYEISGGLMGVAHDYRYRTYSATFDCNFRSFLVDDDETIARREAGWAALHDRLALPQSRIERVTFRDQTFFKEPQNAAQVLAEIRDNTGLTRQSAPNQAVLLRRLEELGEDAMFHRTTMTLSVNLPQNKEAAAEMDEGIHELLALEVYAFLSVALGSESGHSPIGLKSAQVLTRNNLVLEKRMTLDPVYGQPLWQRWHQSGNENELLDGGIATPEFADFSHDTHCVVGRTIHKGFVVKEPDQRGILPEHFWNLLRIPIPKTVTYVFYGVPPKKAQRGAELRRGSARGRNIELERLGKQIKEVHDVEEEKAQAHEAELARSQGQVGRARVFIDLTAASHDELQSSVLRLDNAIWNTGLSPLASLDGQQHWAPSVAMPLARGLALPHKGVLGWIDM